MLDQLEALRALHEVGTTGRAALRLRITQSAVSKRVAALEARLGVPLVEKDGRRVRLTPAGLRLLDEVVPLLREMDARVAGLAEGGPTRLRLAATESLVAAWLPARLRVALDTVPEVRLELHAHRGPVVLDRVRAGEVDLAICVTTGEDGLVVEPLLMEPMVVVPRGLEPIAPEDGEVVEVWTIEAGSLTGAWLARRLSRTRGGPRLEVVARIESFTSAVQLAKAGFGHALVPVGVARSLGVPEGVLVPIPGPGRPVGVCARPVTHGRPAVARFVAALREGCRAV